MRPELKHPYGRRYPKEFNTFHPYERFHSAQPLTTACPVPSLRHVRSLSHQLEIKAVPQTELQPRPAMPIQMNSSTPHALPCKRLYSPCQSDQAHHLSTPLPSCFQSVLRSLTLPFAAPPCIPPILDRRTGTCRRWQYPQRSWKAHCRNGRCQSTWTYDPSSQMSLPSSLHPLWGLVSLSDDSYGVDLHSNCPSDRVPWVPSSPLASRC